MVWVKVRCGAGRAGAWGGTVNNGVGRGGDPPLDKYWGPGPGRCALVVHWSAAPQPQPLGPRCLQRHARPDPACTCHAAAGTVCASRPPFSKPPNRPGPGSHHHLAVQAAAVRVEGLGPGAPPAGRCLGGRRLPRARRVCRHRRGRPYLPHVEGGEVGGRTSVGTDLAWQVPCCFELRLADQKWCFEPRLADQEWGRGAGHGCGTRLQPARPQETSAVRLLYTHNCSAKGRPTSDDTAPRRPGTAMPGEAATPCGARPRPPAAAASDTAPPQGSKPCLHACQLPSHAPWGCHAHRTACRWTAARRRGRCAPRAASRRAGAGSTPLVAAPRAGRRRHRRLRGTRARA